jgi:hypothetical protein
MAKVLTKIKLDEVSLCDRGAGEGTVVKLVKNRSADAPPTAFTTREAVLQAAADAYTAEAVAKADRRGDATSEFQRYRSRLFAKREPAEATPAPAPINKSYATLMKRAEELAKREGITEATAFERLCADPANAELFAKAKRPASAVKPQQGAINVDPEDDEDLDGEDADTDTGDDTDAGHDGIGIKPFEGASGDGSGRSQGGPYLNGSNVRQFPRSATVGAVEGSYDPARRPASALRKLGPAAECALTPKQSRRYQKFMTKSPNATRNDGLWYARATKEQRDRYKTAARQAG